MLGKVRLVGPHALRWAEGALSAHGVRGMRIIQGLLSLSRKHPAAAIEAACDQAWRNGVFRYRAVKGLLQRKEPRQQRSGEYLFEIVLRRHEVRSTMMTSNRPLEDWGKLLGDVPSATAILDRFLHHAEVIQITGRSYRLASREKAPKDTKAPTGSAADEKAQNQAQRIPLSTSPSKNPSAGIF